MARKRVKPSGPSTGTWSARPSSTHSASSTPGGRQSNPVMLAVEIGGVLTTLAFLAALVSPGAEPALFPGLVSLWLWLTVYFSNVAESLSEGRGKARAASLRASRTGVNGPQALRALAHRADRGGPLDRPRARRPRAGPRGRPGPVRRRGRRGRGPGERGGDHGRIGPCRPRVGRRPVGRDRRDDRARERGRGPDHGRPGPDLPRPDDRDGRGGRAAQDPERGRARGPALRPDRGLRGRGREPLPGLGLQRGLERAGRGGRPRRARRPLRLPGPDHDRGPPPCDRDRGHGPALPAERGRALGEGDRGRGGRERPPARQDRDDHARQPAGGRVRPRERPGARGPGRGVPPRLVSRTRPRRGARSSTSPGRAGPERPCPADAVFVPFSAQTRQSGVDCGGVRYRKGAPDTIVREVAAAGGTVPPDLEAKVNGIAAERRDAARGLEGRRDPRRGPPEGHPEAGHPRAVRGPPPDWDPDHDDHRGQPPHRGRDRGRGRGRRLPRRGEAGRQAPA